MFSTKSWQRLINSFKFALRGLRFLLQNERNFQIHIVVAILVMGLGLALGLSRTEYCILLLCIGLVLTAEALNTAMEQLADYAQPKQDPLIGRLKDIAAGGVLLAALVALITGLILFVPHLADLWQHS